MIGNTAADRHLKTGTEQDVAFLPLIGFKIRPIHRDAALAASEPQGARHRCQRFEHVVETKPTLTGTEPTYALSQREPDGLLVRLDMAVGFVGCQAFQNTVAHVGHAANGGTVDDLIANQHADRSIRMERSVVGHLAEGGGYALCLFQIEADALDRLAKADEELTPVLSRRWVVSLKDEEFMRLGRHGAGRGLLASCRAQAKFRPDFLNCPTERRREDPSRKSRKTWIMPPRTAVFEQCGQRRIFERIDKATDGLTRASSLLEFFNQFASQTCPHRHVDIPA